MPRLNRPLRRTSAADPDDVLGVKFAFHELGYYDPPTGEFHPWPDAPLFEAIESFQVDNDLDADGEMLPGGPTELVLNSLPAPGSAPAPNAYERAVAEGLVRPEDAISDSESWSRSVERRTGQQLTPAFAPAVVAGGIALAEAGKIVLPGLLGGLAAAAALGAARRGAPVSPDASPMEGDGRRRAALPPEKPIPPRDFDPEEARKIQELLQRPPQPEPVLPMEPEQLIPPALNPEEWIEIFPDQSGELPSFIIIERKGSPPIRNYNKTFNDALAEAGKREGAVVKKSFGAHDKDGNQQKELYLNGPHEGSTKDGSYLDFGVEIDGVEVRIFGNSQSVRKDGSPIPAEAKQVIKVLNNKKEGDLFVVVPKPAAGETVDFEALVENLRPIVRAAQGKSHSIARTAPIRLTPRFRRD